METTIVMSAGLWGSKFPIDQTGIEHRGAAATDVEGVTAIIADRQDMQINVFTVFIACTFNSGDVIVAVPQTRYLYHIGFFFVKHLQGVFCSYAFPALPGSECMPIFDPRFRSGIRGMV